ncbi:MAG: METTL5 family protein [Thermoplasmataceae archaeon]
MNYLEQFSTDSSLASYILNIAVLDGNLNEKKVIDLGSGNGIFAIGAKLLGASSVTALDIDSEQISVIEKNAKAMDVKIDTLNEDVAEVTGYYDTCFMNPPFGSISAHADLPFIQKACEVADNIYAIHNYKSKEFILKEYSKKNFNRITWEKVSLAMKRTYSYHSKDIVNIDCLLIRCNRV